VVYRDYNSIAVLYDRSTSVSVLDTGPSLRSSIRVGELAVDQQVQRSGVEAMSDL